VYKLLLKPFFFLFNPEKAHYMVFDMTRITLKVPGMKSVFKSLFSFEDKKLERELFGLKFKNPVGLAAGLDKNAMLIHELQTLGFGFVEIGTVTPMPQAGNDKPRLFRLPQDEAVINRMGFNNDGMEAIVERLKNRPKGLIVGGNIGKVFQCLT
jgi:dihydroorotate dehydrogenase